MELEDFGDGDEAACDGDIGLAELDPDQLEQLVELFANVEPLKALTMLYGDDLELI